LVSWHTDRPLRNASIIAVASDNKRFKEPFLGSTLAGEGRKRFRIEVDPILGERYVQLYLFYTPAATERRIAIVRVTKASSSTA
jgi:hypothetical protein